MKPVHENHLDKIKVVLIGHPGSQKIVPASKYLTKKYLHGFDITYLNYKGPIEGWAHYVAGYLEYLTDENVIFALDDYLVAGPINQNQFKEAKDAIGGALVSAKLCDCSDLEQENYPVTTQYTIWDRSFLIGLLKRVQTPWQFEIDGSRVFKGIGAQTILRPCIPYFTNSSLSARWEGINLSGLTEEDINELKQNGLI